MEKNQIVIIYTRTFLLGFENLTLKKNIADSFLIIKSIFLVLYDHLSNFSY